MLTIIIPTLNEEKYLPLLLESIKKQKVDRSYEIIVSDAGSEDRTCDVARDYGCKIVRGGLPAKGRNQGAKAAQGDLLLFLDSEVVLPEGFLEGALKEFQERNLGSAGCALEPVREKWIPRFVPSSFVCNILYNWPTRILEDVFPYAASLILIKKEIHDKLGGFDEGIKIAEDHDYVRRAAKIEKFGVLRFSKLPLFFRRCQKEGIIKTELKCFFCNISNVATADVRSNLLRYNFGQYKKIGKKYKDSKKTNFLFQGIWYLLAYFLTAVGFITWLVIFLIFTPKMIKRKFIK